MARIKYYDTKVGRWEYADAQYSVVDGGLGSSNIYVQEDEPQNAANGALWVDLNSGASLNPDTPLHSSKCFIAQPTPPADISMLWLDTDDNSDQADDTVNSGIGGNVDLTGVVRSVNGQTPDENGNVEISASGDGLSDTAKSLLVTILRNAVYSSDQSANITALATVLNTNGSNGDSGDDSGETTSYVVVNTLSNVVTTNTATTVEANTSYSATLTAENGYEISVVTVLMGGVDVTDTVYTNGVISIPAVTGVVIITATAVIPDSGDDTHGELLYNWDLTKSLTDTVGGSVATLSASGATQDSNGLTLASSSAYMMTDVPVNVDRTYEIDIKSVYNPTTGHGRLFAVRGGSGSYDSGFIYRSGTKWAVYGGWTESELTDPNAFDGKTLVIKINSSEKWSIYRNDELIIPECAVGFKPEHPFAIGSPAGSSFYNIVITAIRVYDGV